MDWLTGIFHYVWFDVLFILIAITVVYLCIGNQTLPGMRRLLVASGDAPPPRPRDHWEEELQNMGFRHLGDYDCSMLAIIATQMRCYESEEGLHTAVLIDFPSQDNFVIEFVTDLHPTGEICTNNSRHGGVLFSPPQKIATRVSWKRNAQSLFKLHQAFCDIAVRHSFLPKQSDRAPFDELMIAGTRRDLEHQVRAGRMRRVGPDAYRFTLKGAAIATPRVWWQMIHGGLLGWAHPSDAALCRSVERRFQKLRQTNLAIWET